jgi:Fe-S-cluster containining protein
MTPLHERWVHALLGAPFPEETNATCHDCAMVTDEPGQPGYSPDSKCCTYMPEVWNFLAGGVLLDDGAESARGRATLQARLDAGMGVTPLGLGRPAAYSVLYDNAHPAFGANQSLLCPHFLRENGGRCGIWRHRESTCSTFFCKHTRGAVGRELWTRLRLLLRTAEESLACWSLLELGLEPAALAALYPGPQAREPELTAGDLDRRPDPAHLRSVWGRWIGRKAELYKECARLVAPLEWEDVLRLGGARLALHSRLVTNQFERWESDAVPERPTAALVQITPRPRGRARLATYSDLDALEVPAALAGVLHQFDGRPTAEVLAEIRRRDGLDISPALVRKLTDFGVLREPGGPAGGTRR